MVDNSKRNFLQLGAAAIATAIVPGAAFAEGAEGVCDPTPEATQGQWSVRKATQVVSDIFQKMDGHTNESGTLDVDAFKAEAGSLLRSVSDYNMSYIPQLVHVVAQDRHDEAHSALGDGYILIEDDSTLKADLNELSEQISTQEFPSLAYKEAVVESVKTGSWTAVMTGLEQVRSDEIHAVNAGIQDVLACRAGYNAKLAL